MYSQLLNVLESNDLPKLGDDSSLSLEVKKNQDMHNCSHLIPADMFICSEMEIPGVANIGNFCCQESARIDVKDIKLAFSDKRMAEFEKEFCENIMEEQGRALQVVRRKLKVSLCCIFVFHSSIRFAQSTQPPLNHRSAV